MTQKGGKRAKIISKFGEQISTDERKENVSYLIEKILGKYTHQKIKKYMIKMVDDYVIVGLKDMISKFDEIIKLLDQLQEIISIPNMKLNRKKNEHYQIPKFIELYNYGHNSADVISILTKILFIIDGIQQISHAVSSFFVDIFFLRRFLDKDYITNAISYTGAYHSTNYIYILTQQFGFKITHASYAQYDISTLNDKIKGMELGNDFRFIFFPPELQQCSNLEGFPDNFT